MAIYLITGKLGAGKTLSCVGRIQEVLGEGRTVATNLDIRTEALRGERSRKRGDLYRLPDIPSVLDLEALGTGNESLDESKNGVIVLDELSVWLNSRTYADKERQPVISWLVHSRKKGWDVYFIAQNINQIDKQIRESLVEYHVICRRMDRINIPVVGQIGTAIRGKPFKLPRVHIAVVKYGTQPDALVADRWVYTGNDLFAAYDTRQVFQPKEHSQHQGISCYLSGWHVKGYSLPPPEPSFKQKIKNWLSGRCVAAKRQPLRPKPPIIQLISKLPPDQRIQHWKRLEALGAIGQ